MLGVGWQGRTCFSTRLRSRRSGHRDGILATQLSGRLDARIATLTEAGGSGMSQGVAKGQASPVPAGRAWALVQVDQDQVFEQVPTIS